MNTQTLQKWDETTLGDICDKVHGTIQTWPFGSQLHESDYSQDGIPVIMPKDIIDGKIQTNNIARVSEKHIVRLQKHKLKPGDIVYGRRGDIGRQALIGKEQDGWLCGTGCLKISLGDKIVNPKFLHYYLRDEEVIKWIFNQAIGATMPNLNTAILRSVPVRIPDVSIQEHIASILSDYDDLIENNIHRIGILERVGKKIYTEWFISFRFPGHEKTKFAEKNLPAGWHPENLSDLVDFVKGIEPGSNNYKSNIEPGHIPFLRVGDLGSRSSEIFVEREILGDRIINKNDIAITLDGTVGRVAIGIYGGYSSGIRKLVIKDKRVNREYLYFLMLSEHIQNIIKSHAKGTTILHASESIKYMKFALPNKVIMTEFGKLIKPIIDEILSLKGQNENLSKTRNQLIPQLVTGKLEIKI